MSSNICLGIDSITNTVNASQSECETYCERNASEEPVPRQHPWHYIELGEVFAHITTIGFNSTCSTQQQAVNVGEISGQSTPTQIHGPGSSQHPSGSSMRNMERNASSSKKTKSSLVAVDQKIQELLEAIKKIQESRTTNSSSAPPKAAEAGNRVSCYSAEDCQQVLENMADLPDDLYTSGVLALTRPSEHRNIFMNMDERMRRIWLEKVHRLGVDSFLK